MKILPEDKRERKWFIGIAIGLSLWWLFYGLFWGQTSPISYIIFGLFVGLICKIKIKRCFYVSLKAAFVPVIFIFFISIIVFFTYIYNVEIKKAHIWGFSGILYIWGLIVFATIIYSLIFSVSSLFGAIIREKYFIRNKRAIDEGDMRILPKVSDERRWVVKIAVIGISIYLSLKFLTIFNIINPNVEIYYKTGEREKYFFTLYLLIYSIVYLMSGFSISPFLNFESRKVLIIFMKGVLLFFSFIFLLIFLSIFEVVSFHIRKLLLALIFGIFYVFGGYLGAYIRQKYF